MISENSRLRFRRLHSTGHRVCSWKVLLQEDESYLIDSSADRCFSLQIVRREPAKNQDFLDRRVRSEQRAPVFIYSKSCKLQMPFVNTAETSRLVRSPVF